MLSTGEGIILSTILYVAWQMGQFYWYVQRDAKPKEIDEVKSEIERISRMLKDVGIEP